MSAGERRAWTGGWKTLQLSDNEVAIKDGLAYLGLQIQRCASGILMRWLESEIKKTVRLNLQGLLQGVDTLPELEEG